MNTVNTRRYRKLDILAMHDSNHEAPRRKHQLGNWLHLLVAGGVLGTVRGTGTTPGCPMR
jgi:hypothetical protein